MNLKLMTDFVFMAVDIFWDISKAMASFPLSHNLILKDLLIEHAVAQNIYRRMNKVEFEGDLIEFICAANLYAGVGAGILYLDMDVKRLSQFSAVKYLALCEQNKSVMMNIMRGFMRNPKVMSDNLAHIMKLGQGDKSQTPEDIQEMKKFFELISQRIFEQLFSEIVLQENTPK